MKYCPIIFARLILPFSLFFCGLNAHSQTYTWSPPAESVNCSDGSSFISRTGYTVYAGEDVVTSGTSKKPTRIVISFSSGPISIALNETCHTYSDSYEVSNSTCTGYYHPGFTVVEVPPNVSIDAPANREFCAGDQVILTASFDGNDSYNPGGVWRYSRNGAAFATISGETGKELNYTFSESGNYQFRYTAGQCSGGYKSRTVTNFNADPVIKIEGLDPKAPRCRGEKGSVGIKLIELGTNCDISYIIDGNTVTKNNGNSDSYDYTMSASPGTHTLTIEIVDSDDETEYCVYSGNVTIPQAPYEAFGNGDLNTSKKDPSCDGGANGQITISVNPNQGLAPFKWVLLGSEDSIKFDGGESSRTTSVGNTFAADTYTFKVIDACSDVASAQVKLEQGATFTPTFTKLESPYCPGVNNGSATVSIPELGAHTALYKLRNDDSGNEWPYQSANKFNNLPSGRYSATVLIDGQSGCQYGDDDPDNNTYALAKGPEPLSTSFSNNTTFALNCYNAFYPVTISWSGGGSLSSGTYDYSLTISGSSTQSFTNLTGTSQSVSLPAGGYTFTVADPCGNSISRSFTITQPADFALTSTVTDLTCFENGTGVIHANITGGKDYKNLDVSLFLDGSSSSLLHLEGRNCGDGCYEFTGLQAGDYTIKVQDANNLCSYSKNFPDIIVEQPGELAIAEVTGTHFAADQVWDMPDGLWIQCNGDLVDFNFPNQGGTAPFTYEISGGTLETAINGTTDNSGNIPQVTNIGPGTYDLVLDDANGCPTAERSFTLQEKDALTLSLVDSVYANAGNAKCLGENNGYITATAGGGYAGYQYVLSGTPGGTTSSDNSSDQVVFSNLNVGYNPINYSVSITDQLQCPLSDNITLNPPVRVGVIWSYDSPTRDQYEVLCNGDLAEVRFEASDGDSRLYELFIDEVSRGTFSAGGSLLVDTLGAGVYDVHVVDGLGCFSATRTLQIDEPDPLQLSIDTVKYPICIWTEGTIAASATGGIAYSGNAYRYQIRRIDTEDFDPYVEDVSTIFSKPAGDNGYDSMEYVVRVTDSYGCTDDVLVIMPPNPHYLTLVLDENQPPSCDDGTDGEITVTATNFRPINDSLIFKISGGHYEIVKDTQVVINTADTSSFTFTFKDLHDTKHTSNGNYTVWVEDYYMCVDTASQMVPNVPLVAPERLRLSTDTVLAPSCLDGVNGWMIIRSKGGVAPYQYSFDGRSFEGANLTDSTYRVADLKSREYVVALRGAHYVATQPTCEVTDTFTVYDGFDMQFELSEIDSVSCYGGADGSIELKMGFAYENQSYLIDSARFSVLWAESGSTSYELTNLSAGTYNLTAEYDQDSITCREYFDPKISQPATAFEIDNFIVHPSSCGNDDDGFVEVDFSGGWPSHLVHYKLDDGPWIPVGSDFTHLLQDLDVGTHVVQYGKSNYQCVESRSFEIFPGRIAVSVQSVVNPSCNGSADGQVVLTTLVDSLEYLIVGTTYRSSSNVYTGLTAGNYELVVRDTTDLACFSDTIPVTLTEPDLLAVEVTPSPADCGMQNGSVSVEISGGTSPHLVKWRFADGRVANPDKLAAGNYYVTVSDQKGCEITEAFIVEDNPGISIQNIVITPSDCNYPNGTLAFTIADGEPPYTADGELLGTSESILLEDLPGGFHSFEIADSRGCQMEIETNVPVQNKLSLELSELERANCASSNGSLEVSVTDGNPPFLFDWEDFDENTNTLTGLSVGAYNVLITDAYGCELDTTFNILPADGVRSALFAQTGSYCNQPNGSLSVYEIDGDFPPFTIELVTSSGAETVGTFSATDSIVIDGLEAGTYALNIYDSKNCLYPTGGLRIRDNPDRNLLLTGQIADSSSCGRADGALRVNVQNGQPPYSYVWYDNEGALLGADTDVAGGLPEGTYEVYVEDQLGCSSTLYIDLIDKSSPKIRLEATSSSPAGASIGEIAVSSSGGAGLPYTYRLFQENTELNSNQTGTFSTLYPGIYQIVAEDGAGCYSGTIDVPVDSTDALSLLVVNSSPATCEASPDGAVVLAATGGVPPYQFTIDGTGTTGEVSDLAVGEYVLTVTDDVGSTKSLVAEISSLPSISVEPIVEAAICSGTCNGSISLLISGGSGNFKVEWEGGITGKNRDGLCSGSYSYLIRDLKSAQCLATGNIDVPEYESVDILLERAASPSCRGGSDGYLQVIATGGSGFYEYEWDTGEADRRLDGQIPGSYSVTVKDTDYGCYTSKTFTLFDTPEIEVIPQITPPSCVDNKDGSITLEIKNAPSPYVVWNTGAKSNFLSGVGAGTYGYTVTSAYGCKISGEVEVVDIPPLQVEVTKTHNTCYSQCLGEIGLNITDGTAPYFVKWESGSRSKNLKNLCNGIYKYTVEDANACIVTGMVEIASPEPIVVSTVAQTNISCYGGDDGYIEIAVEGGVGNYSFEWSTGQTGSSVGDLSADNYQVIVYDSLECHTTVEFELTQPSQFYSTGDIVVDPTCPGFHDGKVILNPTGGTLPYTYLWDTGDTTVSIENLAAGAYTVEMVDARECGFWRTFHLEDPEGLEILSKSLTDPICHDDSTGTLDISVAGGSPPYEYLWNQQEVTVPVSGIPHGLHHMTILDQNGCFIRDSSLFNNPSIPEVTGVDEYEIMCLGASLLLTPQEEWKTYHWKGPNGFSSGESEVWIDQGGDYTLTVTDLNDCPATVSTFVEASENPLSADFIRISEAIVFEPLILVDLSLPIPDSIHWLVPDDPNIGISAEDDAYLEVVFTEVGSYEIGIRAYLNNCIAEEYKVITITEPEETEEDAGGRVDDSSPVDMDIYPNPATDRISLLVHAPSEKPLKLQLINLNKVIRKEMELSGQKDYLVNWDLTGVGAGMHLLIIQYENSVQMKRILIMR